MSLRSASGRSWHDAGAAYLLAGSLLYLVGTVMVTIVFNVPRNNALAAVGPDSVDGARVWAGYLTSWTAWNHVRTVAALAAAGSLTDGLALSRSGGPV
ncbi:MAG TPA: anthrone oxygenase family protein [Gemmatimonadales bacterium]|nr:anthrone oxygenase family protein [Gemmatimonadales bacterium]